MIFLLIVLAATSTTVALWLAFYSFQQQRSAIGYAFSGFAFALAMWAGPYTLKFFFSDPATLTTLTKISTIGIITVAPAWFIFVAIFTDDVGWLSDAHDNLLQRAAMLFVLPLLFIAFMLTNDLHSLYWSEDIFIDFYDIVLHSSEASVVFWLHTLYAFGLLLYATTLLLRAGANAVRFKQIQAMRITIASLFPWFINILVLTNTNPLTPLDLTPLTFAFSAWLVANVVLDDDKFKRITMARDVIISSMNDGVIIIDLDDLIVDINPAATKLLDIDANKVIGNPINQALIPHPDIIACYMLMMKSQTQREEARLKGQRDGADVQVSYAPVSNRVGRIVGRMLILQDISERKEAQAEASRQMAYRDYLRQIDVRISSTLEIDHVLEIGLDAAVILSGASAGFISLVDEDKQKIMRTWGGYPEAFEGHTFPATMGIVGRVIRQREGVLIASVHDDPDYYPDIASTASQMTLPLIGHEQVIGVLNLESEHHGIFKEDVFEVIKLLATRLAIGIENAQLYTTTQKQLRELQVLYDQVSDLERVKTDMIRIASHDLNNPLNAIENYIELLKLDSDKLSDDHNKIIATISDLTTNMEQIITEILSVERLHHDSGPIPVDMTAIITQVVKDQHPQAKLKQQTLIFEPPSLPLTLYGDRAQLREAASNIISNAIKYTPEGGTINILLETDGSSINYAVTDNGYGIPQDQHDKLFQPFSRAASQETQIIEGSGLGLHLVKNIVERHGGKIRFSSVYGEGSTFGFELPLTVM